PAASTTRQDPARMPRGTPARAASPNPISTRFKVAAMLSTSARSFNRLGKLLITSAGLGRMTGDISRSSGRPPLVTIHQTNSTTPIAPAPTRRRVIGDGVNRSVRIDGFESDGIYLA